METWSVLEWRKVNEGVHLHAVLRGTAGLTTAWANEVIQALGKPYVSCVDPIEDMLIKEEAQVNGDIVGYLTKQLRDGDILAGWPPYTHVVSATPGWLPREIEPAFDTEYAA